MDREPKTAIVLFSFLLTVGIFANRGQSVIFLLVLATIGIISALARRSIYYKYGIVTFTTLLILLYPASNTGWLYGRDSHGLAIIAQSIKQSGTWPTDVLYVWGDPQTPISHVLLAVTSSVTELPIYPRVVGRALITSLLPYFNVAVTVGVVYLILRRRNSGQGHQASVFLLPLVFWIPLFRYYTAARRGSFTLVFFTLILFLLLIAGKDKRIRGLILILTGTTIATHMAGGFLTIALLFAFAVATPRRYSKLAFVGGMLFILWQMRTFKLQYLAGILTNLISIGGFFTASAAPYQAATTITVIQKYSTFGYIGVLAVLLIVGVVTAAQKSELDHYTVSALIFSTFAGLLTGIMYLARGGLGVKRVMTYFVLVGGWLGFKILSDISIHPDYKKIAFTLVIVSLVVLSGVTVEPHVITDAQPRYQAGESDVRFDKTTYAAAYFVADYITDRRIIGDNNIVEIAVPTAQLKGSTPPGPVRNAHVPKDSIVLLNNRNQQLYQGLSEEGWTRLFPEPRILDTVGRNGSKIYSNGDERGYVR